MFAIAFYGNRILLELHSSRIAFYGNRFCYSMLMLSHRMLLLSHQGRR